MHLNHYKGHFSTGMTRGDSESKSANLREHRAIGQNNVNEDRSSCHPFPVFSL